jgi:dihydroorotase-like cyclic amidohydrolase
MKTYTELTKDQQEKAVEKELTGLLTGIIKGAIRFNDEMNDDDLQDRIDKACEKAEEMRTPWFMHEYILDTCREDLMGMALVSAEDALYSEQNENIIGGIA